MRILLKFILAFGFIMVLGATFIAIDQYATPERKEAFNTHVDGIADAMAEIPAESEPGRRGRGKGLWKSIQALANGVFRSAPIELAEIMPPAPDGWQKRPFAPTDVALIANEETTALRKFSQAAGAEALGSAMVYRNGERVVAIRMQGELDSFRKADAGTRAEKALLFSMRPPPNEAQLFMTVDGMPIGILPQFTSNSDTRYPTGYRRFVFTIGHLVEGEVVARASDADLVKILGGIDFAALQLELDQTTERFVMGKGVAWAGDSAPSTDVPPHTIAYRAHLLLRAEGGPAREDAETLKLIARGLVTGWNQMAKLPTTTHRVSDDVIELLGPEPQGLAAVRAATTLLIEDRKRLKPHQKYLLGDISEQRVTTQAELRAKSYWQPDWDEKLAEIIAMLPD